MRAKCDKCGTTKYLHGGKGELCECGGKVDASNAVSDEVVKAGESDEVKNEDLKKAGLDASDQQKADIVHCRDSSAAGEKLGAGEPWKPGAPVSFMWMPAGISTITAGFRKGSIELTVQCDESTAQAVQASLDNWRTDRPKQEPFGCIEHREAEASFRITASGGFKWNGDGVYLAAEPTTLGAENVNGKIHRSWSPSFTTDAEYAKAAENDGVLIFPEGVRGSRSNPAKITGVDFCVGTLTNRPAFHSMNPVRAKEGEKLTASNTADASAVQAHCGKTLLQEVPDATAAETALYEKMVHDGGSHDVAVEEIRKQRKLVSSASEPITPETIYAQHVAAVAKANEIAIENNVTQLTADDVHGQLFPVVGAIKKENTPTVTASKEPLVRLDEVLKQIYARAGAND